MRRDAGRTRRCRHRRLPLFAAASPRTGRLRASRIPSQPPQRWPRRSRCRRATARRPARCARNRRHGCRRRSFGAARHRGVHHTIGCPHPGDARRRSCPDDRHRDDRGALGDDPLRPTCPDRRLHGTGGFRNGHPRERGCRTARRSTRSRTTTSSQGSTRRASGIRSSSPGRSKTAAPTLPTVIATLADYQADRFRGNNAIDAAIASHHRRRRRYRDSAGRLRLAELDDRVRDGRAGRAEVRAYDRVDDRVDQRGQRRRRRLLLPIDRHHLLPRLRGSLRQSVLDPRRVSPVQCLRRFWLARRHHWLQQPRGPYCSPAATASRSPIRSMPCCSAST